MTIPYMFGENNTLKKTIITAISKMNNIVLPDMDMTYVKQDDNFIYYQMTVIDENSQYTGSFIVKVAKAGNGSIKLTVYPNLDTGELNSYVDYKINDLISTKEYREGKIDDINVSSIVAYSRPGKNKVVSKVETPIYTYTATFSHPYLDYEIIHAFMQLVGKMSNTNIFIGLKHIKHRKIKSVDYFELETTDYNIDEQGNMLGKFEPYDQNNKILYLYKEEKILDIIIKHLNDVTGEDFSPYKQYLEYCAMIIGGVEVSKGKFSCLDLFFMNDGNPKLGWGVITFYANKGDDSNEPKIMDYHLETERDGRLDISKIFGTWLKRTYPSNMYKLTTKLLGEYKNNKSKPKNLASIDYSYMYNTFDTIPTTSSLYHKDNKLLEELEYPNLLDKYYQIVPIFTGFRLSWHFDGEYGGNMVYIDEDADVNPNNLLDYIEKKYNVKLLTEKDGLYLEEIGETYENSGIFMYQLIAKSGLAAIIHGYNDSVYVQIHTKKQNSAGNNSI